MTQQPLNFKTMLPYGFANLHPIFIIQAIMEKAIFFIPKLNIKHMPLLKA